MRLKSKTIRNSCPKGTFCFRNITIYIFAFTLLLGGYFYHKTIKDLISSLSSSRPLHPSNSQQQYTSNSRQQYISNFHPPPQNNKNVLLDPFTPPLKTNNFSNDQTFSQIGILTPINADSNSGPIPLMAKPTYSNRNKWQYYSLSGQFHQMKLPLIHNGRKTMTEFGIDEISNGETIHIDGLKNNYSVSLYDNNNIPYNPFI